MTCVIPINAEYLRSFSQVSLTASPSMKHVNLVSGLLFGHKEIKEKI